MKSILEFLRKPASSSVDLREKAAEIAAAIPIAETEASRLTAERASRLLDASDKDLEAIERQIADVQRNADRLRAAEEEISRRLVAAEADEARRALTARRDEVERQARAVANRLRTRYPELGRELAEMIGELEIAEQAVADLNSELIEAGRAGERLAGIEERIVPEDPHIRRDLTSVRSASLPPFVGFDGLGLAKARADIGGYDPDALAAAAE